MCNSKSAFCIFCLAAVLFCPLFSAAGSQRGQEKGPGDKVPAEKSPADIKDYFELTEYIAIPETLVEKLRAREKGVLVVDVRRPERFDERRIRGAINYPWKGGVFLSLYKTLPKDGEIFLVSEDGGFSLDALRLLIAAGYPRVYSIEGGMQNWPYTDLLEGGAEGETPLSSEKTRGSDAPR